jgi:rhodanese-related sulfurtransferase
MINILKGIIASAILATAMFASANVKVIDMAEAEKHYEAKSALFLDARPNNLFQRGTIPGSMSMDYKEYDKLKKFLPADKKVMIVAFCNGLKCEHSDHLAQLLLKDGYKNVVNYKGGYPEWSEKKKPAMGILKECKEESKSAYTPKRAAQTINGATVHLIDGDDTMVDQFWFAELVLSGKIPANVQLIDIRKPDQFAEGHIKGAINIPLVDEKLDATKLPKDKFNVVYCNTGMQSIGAVSSVTNNDGSLVYFDATINCKGTECTIVPNELF